MASIEEGVKVTITFCLWQDSEEEYVVREKRTKTVSEDYETLEADEEGVMVPVTKQRDVQELIIEEDDNGIPMTLYGEVTKTLRFSKSE